MIKKMSGVILLLSLLVAILFFRFWQLDQFPLGFFPDESSIAFNAYAIAKSGVDEHGVRLPVYFKAFGEYKNPLFIYASVPVIQVLGLSRYSARLVSALLFVMAAGVLVVILKQQAGDNRQNRWPIILAGTFFLALPWTFLLGRVVFEIAAFPLLFFAGLLCLVKFDHQVNSRRQLFWWLGFTVSMGLLFYSYTVARFLAPILWLVAGGLWRKKLGPVRLVVSGLVFGLFLWPAVWWESAYPGSLLARYQMVATEASYFDYLINYLKHVSPYFIFSLGDGNQRHSIVGQGLLYASTLPFCVVGLWQICQQESRKLGSWLVAGLLLSPIPASLTLPVPHVLRVVGLMSILSYLMGLGVVSMWQRQSQRKIAVALSLMILFQSVIFLRYYFTQYQFESGAWFEVETVEALEAAVRIPNKEQYLISDRLYPGSYATAYFALAEHQRLSPAEVMARTTLVHINTEFFQQYDHGVVVMTTSECQDHIVILQQFPLEFENNSVCMYSLH
jgi:4-amino-4-deoxy-L-arabinose transferase-like glycosyltransferase